MLEKYVDDGVMDYKGFKNDKAKLDQYLKVMEETHTKAHPRCDQSAPISNAKNPRIIRLIVSAYSGIKSIKGLGSLFKIP